MKYGDCRPWGYKTGKKLEQFENNDNMPAPKEYKIIDYMRRREGGSLVSFYLQSVSYFILIIQSVMILCIDSDD